MATPIRKSVHASAFAALVLTAFGLAHAVGVIVFIEGYESSADLIGKVGRQLPVTGVYFVAAFLGWLLGVAPEMQPPPSRIRGALVAGLGIPVLASVVVVILDATGVMDFSRGSSTPEDGLTRLSPALLYLIPAGGLGYWLTRPSEGAKTGTAQRRAAA